MVNLTIALEKAKPSATSVGAGQKNFYSFSLLCYHLSIAKLTTNFGENEVGTALTAIKSLEIPKEHLFTPLRSDENESLNPTIIDGFHANNKNEPRDHS